MKFVCVFIVFVVGCALATPVEKSYKDIQIVQQESDIGEEGRYRYRYAIETLFTCDLEKKSLKRAQLET